ncbi:MAG: type II toxin-antitoxin system VapC family toxin [Verrucomicrobia bacterium]|nr:type II toxin-antitoxin system VapC family toxin [Verrucomicrobiota bacterium]
MDAPSRPLVAVDANVLMDLGAESDTVIDAIETIRARLTSPRLVIPPTPQHELAHIARYADTTEERDRALTGITAARRWRIVPINLMPVGHGIVERIGKRLRSAGLLPAAEINDSFLLAETAWLDGRLLLSSDEHLRGMDHRQLGLVLQEFDLSVPVITTPGEAVKKFFQR